MCECEKCNTPLEYLDGRTINEYRAQELKNLWSYKIENPNS